MRQTALPRRLARIRLVSPERDLIERLDRVEVARGTLRYAATSAPDEEGARRLVARLRRAAPELEHDLRLVEDDRPELIAPRLAALARGRGVSLVARALAERRVALPLAFTWRKEERPPPRRIPRLRIGPILGYPRCCVRFEEARRAAIVRAEAEGMLETWRPRSVADVLRAIDERRPFLCDEVGDEAGRIERLRRFPFVSYVPCPRCCERGAAGAAGRDDERRRKLARGISAALEKKIESLRGHQ
ncbi:MAG: hypothetical protein ACAI25_06415 [Planctomycetota bacterium]